MSLASLKPYITLLSLNASVSDLINRGENANRMGKQLSTFREKKQLRIRFLVEKMCPVTCGLINKQTKRHISSTNMNLYLV